MTISLDDVKKLRDMTGISIMQCRKALEEAGGDMEKAKVLLSKKGGEIASKKSDRELGAGVVVSYVHPGNSVGVLVRLSCETDFVSRNEGFTALAKDIAMHVAAMNPQFLSKEDITEEARDVAKSVFVAEVEGKPEDMKEKILEGKLASYFKDRVLLEQDFIKDPSMTIRALLDSAVQKFGERTEITKFIRLTATGE